MRRHLELVDIKKGGMGLKTTPENFPETLKKAVAEYLANEPTAKIISAYENSQKGHVNKELLYTSFVVIIQNFNYFKIFNVNVWAEGPSENSVSISGLIAKDVIEIIQNADMFFGEYRTANARG